MPIDASRARGRATPHRDGPPWHVEHRDTLLALGGSAAVCLALDCCFWFLADFGSFHPASEGSTWERIFFAGMTAAGPFAMALHGHFSDLGVGLVVELGLVAFLVLPALLLRESVLAKVIACFGVALWFFFGFMVAALRIT